ncbi:MAG TPA: ABC transporter ATP-binding protein [Alphaproteobacteria bacterium]|nr:ABC transporter ATP-binding protein [Alphaproteobacteria bacterium]
MPEILAARNLYRSFGAVHGVNDINVAVDEGEVVGIIGSNGAGKTTFVNIVTGYLKPDSGTVMFRGRDITPLGPKEVTETGICRSFQIPQLFGSATVFENMLIAMGLAESAGLSVWRRLRDATRLERCRATLERFQIADYRNQVAETLPQGVRKLLDIAMATVHAPELIMLDEPTSGITSDEKFGLMDIVVDALREQNVTIMFIEHDMEVIGRYAGRVLAFYDGGIIADGCPEVVLEDERVRRYILGDAHAGRQPA